MKGWKTVGFAVLLGVTTTLSDAGMQQFVADNLPWVGSGLGAVIMALRALTSSPIFKKE